MLEDVLENNFDVSENNFDGMNSILIVSEITFVDSDNIFGVSENNLDSLNSIFDVLENNFRITLWLEDVLETNSDVMNGILNASEITFVDTDNNFGVSEKNFDSLNSILMSLIVTLTNKDDMRITLVLDEVLANNSDVSENNFDGVNTILNVSESTFTDSDKNFDVSENNFVSSNKKRETETLHAIKAVMETGSDPRCSVFCVADGHPDSSFVLRDFMKSWASGGVSLFEVPVDGLDPNMTQIQFSLVVYKARQQQLRQVSWCVTVVVVSDDLAFLAAFAQWSLKGRLLVWSTRLLAVTRLPLRHLQVLHGTYSKTNSMLLIVEDIPLITRCRIYMYLPYTSPGDPPVLLASWTPELGLTLTTNISIFPDKYTKFRQQPTLLAATGPLYYKQEKKARSEGRRINDMLDYLAQGMNFSYRYVVPTDGTFGSKQDDGTWSGMVGMVSREEADIAIGPFGLTESRTEVVDFTWPITIQYSVIIGARGQPVIDPWGFVVPLEPMVWVAILTTLLMVSVMMVLASLCSSIRTDIVHTWEKDTFDLSRILLQQDIIIPENWWWRRLVLLSWMTLALVVSRSYQGDLMSGLAVRYIHQPFQTIRDVLDHPSITMLWQTNSTNVQYIHSLESGIFREVAEAEAKGRLKYKLLSEFPQALSTLVRRGDHVLVDLENVITLIIGQYFTRTGRCDFYSSRERFLPIVLSAIGKRDSPLVPSLSKRIMSLTEAGLYNKWFNDNVPNGTSCVHPPSKITVSTPHSIRNLWGMFVILICGYLLAVNVMCIEVIVHHCASRSSVNTLV
ncbi:glutamate receptor U1-like [Procambarus clarkii]|uniref:glutamate receptor U1-like n=1 Tax=Procambarus clarkii TaxID=6728 RepID=UPI00374491E1